jgi:hypothetical protein
VKFADLLQFQKTPQSLEELHAKATAYAALKPRLRSEFLEECEFETKELLLNKVQDANENLQHTHNIGVDELNAQKVDACTDIFSTQLDSENTLQIKKSKGLHRQFFSKNNALSDFAKTATINRLEPLQSANQFDSLIDALGPHPQTALPLKFRILSRANEIYDANNWATKLDDTPENFFELLMGTAADEYHSDLEPVQNCFLQGATGDFVCNKIFAAPDGYNGATGTAPMCAVGAFALKNTTAEDLPRSISFGLSSYKFSTVYLKTDVWTPLFQSTSNIHRTATMTADFVVPANQTATILLVSTPYHYLHSTRGGDGTIYQSHLVQFLQWNLFGVREMLGDDLVWAQLLGENL